MSSNTLVPHSVIEAVRDADYEWHVWTVDNPKVAKRMQELGAGLITTNKPGKMWEGLTVESVEGEKKKRLMICLCHNIGDYLSRGINGKNTMDRYEVEKKELCFLAKNIFYQGELSWSLSKKAFAKF